MIGICQGMAEFSSPGVGEILALSWALEVGEDFPRLVLMLDGDEAGHRASQQLAKRLRAVPW
jgi:hypothetical protein